MAAQSVLMTAALAIAPGSQTSSCQRSGSWDCRFFPREDNPLSERKSSADRRACVKDRSPSSLESTSYSRNHRDEARIYAAAENQILKDKKLDRTPRRTS